MHEDTILTVTLLVMAVGSVLATVGVIFVRRDTQRLSAEISQRRDGKNAE